MTGEATCEAWRDCPTTCVQDFCLANASDAGVAIDITALESGHSPYFKFAQELAESVVSVSSTRDVKSRRVDLGGTYLARCLYTIRSPYKQLDAIQSMAKKKRKYTTGTL
ncbi:hypothetical protein F5B19DRAFT_449980, partial [Rostrohypoxylon terebratum]